MRAVENATRHFLRICRSERILAILDPKGTRGTAGEAFYIWGPGKTAKLQCDTSAMISTEMFEEFVAPRLTHLAEVPQSRHLAPARPQDKPDGREF